MASASRALFSRASPLHAAASRFLRPLAAAGSLLVLPVALVLSPAAVRRFATQPTNLSRCSKRAKSIEDITVKEKGFLGETLKII
ncbi:hypothetical protein ZWY2020_058505 [Hordeum vulgare]|nr:hypothetical protein ZWY2020_058505 [Hordeum vulgare]